MTFFRTLFLYPLALPFLFCSCSTKYTYETSMEVDIPLEKSWGLYSNPNEWPIVSDDIEYFYCKEEEVETGSIILAKLKNIDPFIPIQATAVEPYKKLVTECKALLFEQKEILTFEETSPEKTRISAQLTARSILVPFMRSRLTKSLDCQYSKIKDHLDQLAVEMQKVDSQCM